MPRVKKVKQSSIEKIRDGIARDAIAENISWHAIPVIMRPGDLQWGSGTLLAIENRQFILTAKHVATHHIGEIGIFLRLEGTLEFSQNIPWVKRIPLRMLKPGPVYVCKILNVFLSDDLDDVAVIEIDRDKVPDRAFHKFIEKPKIDRRGREFFVKGFAAELARVQKIGSHTGLGFFSYLFNTVAMRDPGNILGYIPKRHFLNRYPVDKAFVHPGSLSGAGIWTRDPSGPKLWAANPYLIGIITGFYKKAQCIKATKIERVVDLLKKNKLI